MFLKWPRPSTTTPGRRPRRYAKEAAILIERSERESHGDQTSEAAIAVFVRAGESNSDIEASEAATKGLHAFTRDARASMSRMGNGFLVVLPARAKPRRHASRAAGEAAYRSVRRTLRRRPWVGVSVVRPGRDAVTIALREAREAAELSSALGEGPGVYLYRDMLAFAAVKADQVICRELARVLDPLTVATPRSRALLLDTLERFFHHDLSVVETARELGVHRHTVEYRLKKAEQLIGRSVRKGSDRLMVESALVARRLLKAKSDPTAVPGAAPPQKPRPAH